MSYWHGPTRTSGLVYFATSPLVPGLVKIGRTTRDLRTRMGGLIQLEPRMVFEVPEGWQGNWPNIEAAEKELHRQYDHLRVPSRTSSRRHAPEWFRAEGPLARFQ